MPLTKGVARAQALSQATPVPNDTTKLFKNSLKAKRLCAIKRVLNAPRTYVTTRSSPQSGSGQASRRNDTRNNYTATGTHVPG